jgi:Polysaccharide deacetylase
MNTSCRENAENGYRLLSPQNGTLRATLRCLCYPDVRGGRVGKGKLTISIDLGLAWSIWDVATLEDLQIVETAERPVCAALLELFDRYELPATWGVVATLLDADSAAFRPGSKACWFAPDIVDRIVHAKVAHEIGSHGGKHAQFDRITTAEHRKTSISHARCIEPTLCRSSRSSFRATPSGISMCLPTPDCACSAAETSVGLRRHAVLVAQWDAQQLCR